MQCESSDLAAAIQRDLTGTETSRTGHVLVLETIGTRERDRLIVLDQLTTYISVSAGGGAESRRLAIRRSALGWKLEAPGAECRLNGAAIDESWLCIGDQLEVGDVRFRVRPMTQDELIERLPQFDDAAQDGATPRPERAPGAATTNGEEPIVAELEALRTKKAEFDSRRKRLESWLNSLQQERFAATNPQTLRIAERTRPAPISKRDDSRQEPPARAETALETASSAETVVMSLSEMIAAELAPDRTERAQQRLAECAPVERPDDAPAVSVSFDRSVRRPATAEIRDNLNHFRKLANESARGALKRHFWQRHRPEIILKLALVGMSFALAGVLYVNHGTTGSSVSAMAWGAAAIGLITLSGLAHTWSEFNRMSAKCRSAVSSISIAGTEPAASQVEPRSQPASR